MRDWSAEPPYAETAATGFELLGPAERLHAVLLTRAPQVSAAVVRDEDEGLPYVHVAYQDRGPWIVFREFETYYWQDGPRRNKGLGSTPEQAADRIAEVLGAAAAEADAPVQSGH